MRFTVAIKRVLERRQAAHIRTIQRERIGKRHPRWYGEWQRPLPFESQSLYAENPYRGL
jgi:hypothetical protein